MTGAFAASLDPADLAAAVRTVLVRREELRDSCVRYAEDRLTVDRMVEAHVQAVEHALEIRARG